MQQTSDVPAAIKDRIVATAEALYEQGGFNKMPNVDQVRRAAKTDMNSTSQVMREWRRSKSAQSTPLVVSIPDVIQQSSTAAIAAIWTQAQDLANENLRNAQTAWDVERAEMDDMRAELAEAFETQAAELELLKKQLSELQDVASKQTQELLVANNTAAEVSLRLDASETKCAELERICTAMRIERDDTTKQSQEARERAAKLEGMLEAVQAQNKSLIDAIGSNKAKH